jgi:hypothetical protein
MLSFQGDMFGLRPREFGAHFCLDVDAAHRAPPFFAGSMSETSLMRYTGGDSNVSASGDGRRAIYAPPFTTPGRSR